MQDWMFEPGQDPLSPPLTLWEQPASPDPAAAAWLPPAPADDAQTWLLETPPKGNLDDFGPMFIDGDVSQLDDLVVTGSRPTSLLYDRFSADDHISWGTDEGMGSGGGGGGQDRGGSGGGYPGGSTPEGFTPHEDGTGRFMYDRDGRLHINPQYQAWLRHNDQQIDWAGVASDLARVAGPAYGSIAVGAVRNLIGWGIGAVGDWLSNEDDEN